MNLKWALLLLIACVQPLWAAPDAYRCKETGVHCKRNKECCSKKCAGRYEKRCTDKCKETGVHCKRDRDCCSKKCAGRYEKRCTEPTTLTCPADLNQVLSGGKCVCKHGFLDVNSGDGVFCVPRCFLVNQHCETDKDCCDSGVNTICDPYTSKCTIEHPGTCGSNQEKDYHGKCVCKHGFKDVDRSGHGVFCAPVCEFPGEACDSSTKCCSFSSGPSGFCDTKSHPSTCALGGPRKAAGADAAIPVALPVEAVP